MPRWKENWTEQEVAKLRSMAGTMSLALIAKELDRTTGAVLAKAAEEKLTIVVRSSRASAPWLQAFIGWGKSWKSIRNVSADWKRAADGPRWPQHMRLLPS
ncbi:hypothetical protein [Bradyrhizobium japonicum]|jgi:hypothetical protein|uniref:hypothetical protein n=2 Tax=Nitrobacteraceae TaxID=41294 RepID=UPI0033937923